MKRRLLNSVNLVFPARSANESFARMAVAALAMQLDPTVEELADIKTAVSEAVTNCIVHAYREKSGTIRMCCKHFDDGLLRISVKDNGCGIPDVKRAMEPMYTTDTTGERSGMGFAIMRSFMDGIRVTSRMGKGTSVTMEKTLGSAAAPRK